MGNFNYKEYLRNNPLLQEEVKEENLITESQEKVEVEEEKKELPKSIADKEKAEIEKDAKKSKGMIKVSELKAKIKEDIISILSETEEIEEAEEDVDVDVEDDVEADVDVDVKDTVDVDAEGDDIEIEKKAVKAKVDVGLSPEEEIVQDSLKAAMDAAVALGNEVLADQIGNTITYFTRKVVVGDRTD